MLNKSEWIKQYIPSNTVRDYIERTGHTFSDAEIATITFQSSKPLHTIHQTLTGLAKSTQDMALKQYIEERIAFDRHCLELFECNDGSCFYQICAHRTTETFIIGDTLAHFSSVALALQYMEDKGIPFAIEKYQIVGLREREQLITPKGRWNPRLFPEKAVEEEPYCGAPIAACCYESDGELLQYWTEEISEEDEQKVEDWGAARFEHHFVPLPNPFERGDIVRSHGAIGIVESSQAEWTELMENQEALDYYDAVITVEFPSEGGGFYHDHCSPLELEKIDPTALEEGEEKEVLTAAQALLTGGGSLDWLTRACNDYREAMGHEEY